MTTPLRDPLAGGGTKTVAPTISFQRYGMDNELVGIVVPVEVDGQTRPYRVTQQTDQKGELKFFDKKGQKGVPDPEAPRTQIDVTLATELKNWAGTSRQFLKRQEELDAEDRLEDFGQRRVIIKGGDATKALKEALRVHGLTTLEVGGRLHQTLVDKVQKPGAEFEANVFEFKYEKATPDTIKIAMEMFDRLEALRGAGKSADDSPAGGGSSDEPPF